MVKIYSVHYWTDNYGDEIIYDYVAYFKNDEHIYLVCCEPDCEGDKFIRVKYSDRNKKIIYDYECYYTHTHTVDETRAYDEI